MQSILLIHILAGTLGLATGFVALFAAKGASTHRKAGMLFVYTMIAMSAAALLVMGTRRDWSAASALAATLTAYLVITAVAAVRPPPVASRWLHLAALLVALSVGVAGLTLGFEVLARGRDGHGLPPFPYFMFGAVGLLASLGDLRIIRSGALPGPSRLTRHLWRMCFALWIASASFFLGQADEIPAAIRVPALLAVPAFLPLLVMVYWTWRVRGRRALQGIVGAGAPRAARGEAPPETAGVG